MVKSNKFEDKIVLFWTFNLLRKYKVKKNMDSRKFSKKKSDCPSEIGTVGNYESERFFFVHAKKVYSRNE